MKTVIGLTQGSKAMADLRRLARGKNRWAIPYLEKRGKVFLVDFGYMNAFEILRAIDPNEQRRWRRHWKARHGK